VLTGNDVEVAERLLAHLRNGTSDMADEVLELPAWLYYDEHQAARERTLLRTRPILATHCSALPDPTSFVTLELIGVPVLIVRQGDGTVQAFRNICRHRGGPVEQEASGKHRLFTCRYHGWTYEGDGSIRNIPYEEGFEAVDRACHGLVPVACGERDGLIWVQLEGDSIDVAGYLGDDLDAVFASFGLESWQLYVNEPIEQEINWKLVADGLLDIYHPKFLHPNSVGRLLETNVHVWDRMGVHGRLAMARRKLGQFVDAVPDQEDLRAYVITNFFVYPSTMLVIQPDHIELWTVYPDGESATRSTTLIRFLVPEMPATDEARRPLDLSWEILKDAVVQEDMPMARAIQVAAPETATDHYVIGRNESPVQHLHRQLKADLESATD
jgi:phenylpropionate dioxygenase-like ring-hydroxylating dioxygenase large terminal subunit